MRIEPIYKIGDFVFDKVTNTVAVVEYVEPYCQTYRYLIRNEEIGGFRFQEQLYYSKKDLNGNSIEV